MRRLFLWLSLTFVFSLSAEIFEIKQIKEINLYLIDDQLVVLDLDNTVLKTAQLLGSDQWFDKQLSHYL
ncbi:MAG: DUF2608 domain-containing protein [Chlamydiae bacterium]|nr:DUF2608 domain-containing protein [Chlamydiota bacterium]